MPMDGVFRFCSLYSDSILEAVVLVEWFWEVQVRKTDPE